MRKPTLRSWWDRLALRAKTVVVAGVPLLVLVLAVPILYTTQRSASDVSVAVEHTYRLRQQLAAVLQDLVDAETGVRGFLLTNDARFLQPYRDGVDNLPRDLGAVRRQMGSSSQARAYVHDLEALVSERLDILERVRRYAERTPAGAIGAMDATQARVLADRRHDLEVAQRLSFVLSVVVVPLALLGTIFAVLLFATGLARRVRRIEENAGRLERGEPLLETPGGRTSWPGWGRRSRTRPLDSPSRTPSCESWPWSTRSRACTTAVRSSRSRTTSSRWRSVAAASRPCSSSTSTG